MTLLLLILLLTLLLLLIILLTLLLLLLLLLFLLLLCVFCTISKHGKLDFRTFVWTFGFGQNCCSISARKITKEIFVKIC